MPVIFTSPVLLPLFLFFTIFNGISAITCKPFYCGALNISYPFWVRTNGNEYCGYPGFELTCDSNNETALLHLLTDVYSVTNIDYESKTLSLVDTDLTQTDCPRPRHNVTFDTSSLFSYGEAIANLTFLFNCSDSIIHSLGSYIPTSLTCLEPGSLLSYVVDGLVEGLNWSGLCGESVVVPVLESELKSGSLAGSGYEEILKQGFQLGWTSAGFCSRCEETGGCCGENTVTHTVVCFKHGKTKVWLKIVIGISAAAGTALSAAVFFFIYYRRRKMKQTSPSSLFLTRSMSSDPPTKPDHEKGSTTQFLTNMPTLSLFTYQELEQATNSFNPSNELGDGGFGTVYYGKLRDGRSVAVKRLYENNYKRVEQFMNEVKILSGLRHQNLVCLYGCTSRHSRELLLVYEYIPNGTVADHLHGDLAKVKGGLNWSIRLKIALETAEALAFLHAVEPPIIHRDVKTNNILLDNSYQVKVADFGLSRLFPLDATHVSTAPQGTPGYVDPDYHQCYQLTDKSDVYSFGVVLVELISSKPAVDITRHRHEINLANLAINKIINRALSELVDQSLGFESDFRVRRMMTGVAELAFRCLSAEKEERPTMEEVLEILRGIEKDGIEGKIPKAQPDILADDVVLLKSQVPFSPDSVTEKWASRSTTPNTSNEG